MRSRTIPNSTLLLVVALAFVLPGCSWWHRWQTTTTYEFVGLRPADAPAVEDVFRRRNLPFSRTEREPPTYEVRGIRRMSDFAAVKRDLDRAIEKHDLEVELRGASLHYSGLSGAGDVQTTISVSISPPDSVVHVADGEDASNPWRQIDPDAQGEWTGPVNTAGVVTQTGGWVYVHTRRGSLERVFRVNVLSKEQERWFAALPFKKPPSTGDQ